MESDNSSRAQKAKFTREELKELFSLRLDTACATADLLSSNDTTWKV